MLTYDIFYRHSGVRLPQHLMTPIINPIERFEFPRNSLYNSISFDGIRTAPSNDEYLFRLIKKQILIDHITTLSSFDGNPRKINTPILPYIREFHIHNRRFKYSKGMVGVDRDHSTLMVTNFDFIHKLYKYSRNRLTEAYKWHNLTKTICTVIEEHANVSQRQQFIFSDLPKILPSVQSLLTYSKVFNGNYLNIFPSPESMFILDIWKWLSEDSRAESNLNSISQKNFDKINIVFKDSGKWVMFNLGVLNDWRDVAEEDINSVAKKTRIKPPDLQKRFLRMLMALMHTRSEIPTDQIESPEVDTSNGTSELASQVVNNNTSISPVREQELVAGVTADDEETKTAAANRLLESIDADLKELEVIENIKIAGLVEEDDNGNPIESIGEESNVSIADFNKDTLPEDAIIKICNRQADDGIITAAVFRNLVTSASSYKTIASPDGNGTLEKFIEIPQEFLVINESDPIKDIPTVVDKSMLKSSLLSFDERYVSNVLAKDIAGMVVNIQKAGVILNDYKVEKFSEVLGGYEMHTMRVRPVEGVSSVLRFKVPVVGDDGTLKYNGNLYRLRKQRSDLPIRKISPNTVALTSYYGKTFVRRSDKKVNDYGHWLCNKVMLAGLDGADNSIMNLATGSVFNNEIKQPRLYSLFAQNFISFTAKGFDFNFDYRNIEKFYGQELIKEQSKNDLVLVAQNNKDEILAMDYNGLLFKIDEPNEPLGAIETFLGIDVSNTPVDFAELRVMGKNIAIGLVLAYDIGFTELCDRLKVTPRKVPAGTRLNLTEKEYALSFSDTSLVFSKEDKLATMILAGFNEYDKSIRRYAVAAMDNPNVYLNILESAGLGTRYLRELQNLNNLFVDPITKELLIEMKEPTTFTGLLVRGSEMVLSDEHPDQLDMRFMRIKGYERIAGAVYAELVHSIRSHSGRPGKSSKPLELHPYAVWSRITTDPSMAQVSDLNPIQNLKEMEAVTYSGTGGRNTRTMTRSTREYHESDMGVISESTVDSSSVGVNIYTTADPQFKSVRGTTRPFDFVKNGPATMLSTSALISPGSDHDDPKRVNNLLFLGVNLINNLSKTGNSPLETIRC